MKRIIPDTFIRELKRALKIDETTSACDDAFYKFLEQHDMKQLGNDGCSCTAYGNDTLVVKTGYHSWKLNARMKKYPQFFPETYVVNHEVCVQERCDSSFKLYRKHYKDVRILAQFLGVDDVASGYWGDGPKEDHWQNVGWKKVEGGHIPIFFDLNCAEEPMGTIGGKKRKATMAWQKLVDKIHL